LTKDGTVKIGDLGVSKVNHESMMYTQTGTPYYTCPEIWKDRPYDYKSDVWSFGVIVYEMCSLVPPFDARDMDGLAKKICKGTYTSIPVSYSRELTKVIDYCLQVSPSRRASSGSLWEKSEIQDKIEEFGGYDLIKQEQKLLATIKVPIRFSQIGDQLPDAKYDSTQEETKEESKQKVRLHSARPVTKRLNEYNKKPMIRNKNGSAKKESEKAMAMKNAHVARLYPDSKLKNKLSPSRALKPGVYNPSGVPSSARGRRSPLGSPQREASPRAGYIPSSNYHRPAGVPSYVRKY